MRPNWLKLASLNQKICTLDTFSYLVLFLFPMDNLLKNIFDFTTAGERDCVAAVERISVLHGSVDLGITIAEL